MAGLYIPFEPIKTEFHIIAEFLDFILYLYLEQNMTFSKLTLSPFDVCCLESETALSARSNAVGVSSSVSL